MSDGKTQRCQERCQKETPKIHSGKKESQKSEKAKQLSSPQIFSRLGLKHLQGFETYGQSRTMQFLPANFRAKWDRK
jgi:hypothetical protein